MIVNQVSVDFQAGKPQVAEQLKHLTHLKIATVDHPLNIVVIHGDPTKPNDILPG